MTWRAWSWAFLVIAVAMGCGKEQRSSGEETADGGAPADAAPDRGPPASDDSSGSGSPENDASPTGTADGSAGSSSGGEDGSLEASRSDAGSGMDGGDGATGGPVHTYTTYFPLTENPISQEGRWINGQTTGLDWHDVSTTPGLAIGHQSGSSYTDGTALLTGTWGPTQSVEAVVHTVNQNDPCYQEVELRLRSSLSAHSCNGYEISFKASKTSSAYLIIVRWNGAVGDFTYLARYDGAQYGVAEGDDVKATISGNVITAYLDGVQVGTATDDTYPSGNPGMGFNLETGDSACVGTNGDYGFTKLTATGQ